MARNRNLSLPLAEECSGSIHGVVDSTVVTIGAIKPSCFRAGRKSIFFSERQCCKREHDRGYCHDEKKIEGERELWSEGRRAVSQ